MRRFWNAGAAVLLACTQLADAQIARLPTSETTLVGRFARGPVDLPLLVSLAEFKATFGSSSPAMWPAEVQARQFFANGGSALHVVRLRESGSWTDAFIGSRAELSGIHALTPLSNLRTFIAPEVSLQSSAAFALGFAAVREFAQTHRVFFILDPPPGLGSATAMINWINVAVPEEARFCAVYFPYLQVQVDATAMTVTAGGAMAAVFAKSDAAQGIWKSPAGTAFPLQASGTTPSINSSDGTALNNANVCAIREFAGSGVVPFGSRTLHRGTDADRFISVARTEDLVASSIGRGLAFTAIRDNGEPLWADVRLQVATFLHALWTEGAFQGATASEAYFVRCDASTTTAADFAAHRVNVLYGTALLRANEFELTTLSSSTFDAVRAIPVPQLRYRRFGEQVHLAYPTEAGFDYVLQAADDLARQGWAGGETIRGDGAWRRLFVPIDDERGFHRLLVTPAR